MQRDDAINLKLRVVDSNISSWESSQRNDHCRQFCSFGLCSLGIFRYRVSCGPASRGLCFALGENNEKVPVDENLLLLSAP